MRRAAQRFINYIKSERGMSPATVLSYREDLRKFIEFLEKHWGRYLLPGDVTQEMILAFLDFLANTGYQKKNGPASRARRLVAIRSFFRYLLRNGLLARDPAADIRAPKVTHAEPYYLQEDEYIALLKGATHHRDPFIVLRDQAMIATFLGTGARVSELIHADRKDVDVHAKRIRLHRKGGDTQTLPLSDGVIAYLQPYLKERRHRAHCRAAFVSVRGLRLTQQAISSAVRRCAAAARLPLILGLGPSSPLPERLRLGRKVKAASGWLRLHRQSQLEPLQRQCALANPYHVGHRSSRHAHVHHFFYQAALLLCNGTLDQSPVRA